ncbi:MAG: protein translocase subunit SecF [Patescibacteria group bacterium]
MSIVRSRKIFYILSAVLFSAAALSLVTRGINLGSDFTGDAVLSIHFNSERSAEAVGQTIKSAGISHSSIQFNGSDAIIRTEYLTQEKHDVLLEALRKDGSVEEKSFSSTGPSVGHQLRRNAVISVTIALIAIILYIAWAFRKVSHPLPSWIYGVVAVVALFHDVIIPIGVFSYFRIQVDALFITAVLTVIGFSVHDTIVVFDRVREHLRRGGKEKFETLVDQSLRETISRSINTSLTTLLSMVAVYIFGGEATKNLALTLILGIGVGTYSSIFIASPLLVSIARWRHSGA